jgi:lipopolysaccharide export system permease protein
VRVGRDAAVKSPFLFSRYLVVTLTNWILVVTLAVSSVIIIFDFTELFRRAATKSTIGVGLIFKMLLLHFPTHIQEILPFIVLFAAILAFWQLNRNTELVIMKASGLSIWQILTPMILVALLIGAFDLVCLSPLTAKLMGQFEILQKRYLNEGSENSMLSETGLWFKDRYDTTERLIHVGRIDFNKKLLHNITIYEFDLKNKFSTRSDAHFAHMGHHSLYLHNGWRIQCGTAAEKFEGTRFLTFLNFQNIQGSLADPRTLPFWVLTHYANLMERAGLSNHRYLLYWHSLLAGCIWLGVMVMLAAAFSLKPVRANRTSLMIGTGITLSFLLYFFRDISTAMGLSGTIPSILAAWAPTAITALFAATKLLYSEDG